VISVTARRPNTWLAVNSEPFHFDRVVYPGLRLRIDLDRKQSQAFSGFNPFSGFTGCWNALPFQAEGTASMSDEVWIFVSYAHHDDLQLSASKDEKGFIAFFL
jgi:hypothetical protein